MLLNIFLFAPSLVRQGQKKKSGVGEVRKKKTTNTLTLIFEEVNTTTVEPQYNGTLNFKTKVKCISV